MTKRERGFYWVRMGSAWGGFDQTPEPVQWQVAWWNGRSWRVAGTELEPMPISILGIDERRIVRPAE